MSVADLKGFSKKCVDDKGLQAKAKEIGLNNVDGLITLGKENGFSFTKDDMLAISKEVEKTHKDALNEKQLEAIAGGVVTLTSMAVVGAVAGVASLGIAVGSEASRNW